MSNFTSAFISTTNIGQWDYYIFSDNIGIWRALNGLSAWFGTSGGLLQNAALLGALLLLAIGLFGASVHKPTLSGSQLGVWFFFMSMLGITGQANVYNIYTNQVTVVQNVPALALVPASIFSKAAFKIFTSMETAFQSTTGSYMSVNQSGFVGPLDVLLSLRSPKLAVATPALSQTLTQVVHDCAIDPNSTVQAPAMSQSLDILNWLTIYGRQSGLTRVYSEGDTSGAGVVQSCAEGLDYINTQYGNMASGSTEMLKFVNASTTKLNPQDAKGLWNADSMKNSFDMLIGSAVGMQQSAFQFTKNALVASTVTYTIDCLSQAGSISSPNNCAAGATAMADGMERWKTDSAMEGSGFLKTMFTSMAFLQALFFALFPIIALYGLIVVNKTTKVFGGYIFFGIWCQSWLLMVAPIQSYIQSGIIDEIGKITAGSNGMTLANSMLLYQSLSTKLALAGNLMASSQMLSLALLSGSMVALSGLAGKWSGSQQMDSSNLQNKLSDPASLVKNNPIRSSNSIVDKTGNSITETSQYGSGSAQLTTVLSSTTGASAGDAKTHAQTQSRAKELSTAIEKRTGYALSEKESSDYAVASGEVHGLSGKLSTDIVTDVMGALAKKGNAKVAGALDAEKKAAGGSGGGGVRGVGASIDGKTDTSHKMTDKTSADKSTNDDGSTKVSNADKLNESVTAAHTKSQNVQAGKSAITSTSMSLEPANILHLAAKGDGEYSGEQLAKNANSALIQLAHATDGKGNAKYSDMDWQNARQQASVAMMGRTISNPRAEKFQQDLYTQHFLTGGHIAGVFKNTTGVASGAGYISNVNPSGKEAYEANRDIPNSVPKDNIGANLDSKPFQNTVGAVLTKARNDNRDIMKNGPSTNQILNASDAGSAAAAKHGDAVAMTTVGIAAAAGVAVVANVVTGPLDLIKGLVGGKGDKQVPPAPAPAQNSIPTAVTPIPNPPKPSSGPGITNQQASLPGPSAQGGGNGVGSSMPKPRPSDSPGMPPAGPLVRASRKNNNATDATMSQFASGSGSPLGHVARRFEASQGAATVSSGNGDNGGASYGQYQLSSSKGTLQAFLKTSGYEQAFSGMKPGSAEFNAQWKSMAQTDSNFGNSQHQFMEKTHYQPALQGLKQSGVDLTNRGPSVQEAVWSTATQFGPGRAADGTGAIGVIKAALKGKDFNSMSDGDVVTAIQDRKIERNEEYFASSSPANRVGTLNRAVNEKAVLLNLADRTTTAQSNGPMPAPVRTVAATSSAAQTVAGQQAAPVTMAAAAPVMTAAASAQSNSPMPAPVRTVAATSSAAQTVAGQQAAPVTMAAAAPVMTAAAPAQSNGPMPAPVRTAAATGSAAQTVAGQQAAPVTMAATTPVMSAAAPAQSNGPMPAPVRTAAATGSPAQTVAGQQAAPIAMAASAPVMKAAASAQSNGPMPAPGRTATAATPAQSNRPTTPAQTLASQRPAPVTLASAAPVQNNGPVKKGTLS